MASLNPLQGTLGHRRAAHLLRRTSFRFTKQKVDALAGQTAAQALPSLLQLSPLQLDQPIYNYFDPQNPGAVDIKTWCLPVGAALPDQDFVLRRWVMTWWAHEALNDPGIGHKMSFFWHQYMITTIQTLGSANFFDYLRLMRWGALGNFKKLALKLVTDNVMLKYLNNHDNTKANPNENFAREFLELFTIGKGPQAGPGDYTNYTEDDIVQSAKLLTGFRVNLQRTNIDPETGFPRGVASITQHATGNKTFSPRFQNKTIVGGTNAAGMEKELADYVDLIFAQPETARHLCRRFYRFFVNQKITAEIESDIITPLANLLIASNFEIKPVLERLLQSEHFFDADDSSNTDEIVSGMIKSPIELAFQSLSFFNVPIPDPKTQPQLWFNFYSRVLLQRIFGDANLPLFYANDVAGYSAYHQEPDFSHQWFSSSTIIARYKLGEMLLTGKFSYGANPNQLIGIKLDIVAWTKNGGVISDPSDAYVLVKDLLQYMMAETVDPDRFDYFYTKIFLDGLPAADWTYEWQSYLNTGNPAEVKIPLERLVKAIMYSQEYQTF